MRIKLILLTLFIFTSCAHMRSGKYVQLNDNVTASELAVMFNANKSEIEQANPGAKFRSGERIFIPTKAGLFAQMQRRDIGLFSMPYYGGDFIWPVPASSKISSRYGMRKGKHHDGIDIPAPNGTHILATAKGEVIYAANKIGGYGKMVIIKHSDELFSVYAHASSLLVKKGERVQQGQGIAKVGSTGRSSGPHLHFEIRRNETPINPLKFLPERSRIARH